MRLITHSGTFHADETMAFAVLSKVFPGAELLRTRDEAAISSAPATDIVFDVGSVYAPAQRRYDHHMSDGPKREDGVPYSSVGLVWKHHGLDYLKLCAPAGTAGLEEVWQAIDCGLIRGIDMADNGIGEQSATEFAALVDDFNPAWDDEEGDEDAAFRAASRFAAEVLSRNVERAVARLRARRTVEDAARLSDDPRIVELPRSMPWERAIFDGGFDEALYVVYPRGGTWYCAAVPDRPGSYHQRKPLPEAWAGLRGDELSRESGIEGAVFCHPARFVCGASTRGGALAMAAAAAGPIRRPEPLRR